jgi:Arc/MetJ-type ribon-helix-helix transcriptional regulator
MSKSISAKQKRRGRPPTGQAPFIGIRLPQELIDAVGQRVAAGDFPTRSAAVRRFIEEGLQRTRPGRAKTPSR